MFLKYRSLENHYNLIPDYLPLDMIVTVSEKLDGSNFSIISTEAGISFASRNKVVDPIWNNLKKLIDPELIRKIVQYTLEYGVVVNLYGEVFSNKILRRIPYGDAKVRFFDLAINGEYVSGDDFHTFMCELGVENLMVQPSLMSLKEALDFDVENLHTDYAENSIAEGIVIKPHKSVIINGKVPAIKKKSKKFAELSNTKVKTPQSLNTNQVIFCSYVNKSRVLSYISKEGEPKGMLDMGKYIKGVLTDAYEDYYADLTPEEQMQAEKSVVKAGSKIVANILKARIQG